MPLYPSSTQSQLLTRKATRFDVMRTCWVYILASRNRKTYAGITSDLNRRVLEHKATAGSGHAAKYKINRLVHYEHFSDPNAAIRQEKEIKGRSREKKLRLIESENPGWIDLVVHLNDELP